MSDFERVSPESVGIDSGEILKFLEAERLSGVELHSFMLIRNGKVAAEGWAKPYSKEKKQPMFSFSKTLTAAAVGFAVQEGLLSLDDRLMALFPEYCPPDPGINLARADIRSLLTMSCGHRQEMVQSEVDRFGGNWISAFFAHPFDSEPGTLFQYNTWGTDMLSAAIQKKTGLTLTQYLKPRLFDPLGMENIACSGRRTGDEFTRSVEGGGWGMHLSTEDMGRFIWFLEQGGVWNGRQLLNAGWVRQMTSKQIETDNPVYAPFDSNWKKGYGFQMWMCDPEGISRADGAFGQFGLIMPEQNAVLVLTAATLNTEAELQHVWNILLPAMHALPSSQLSFPAKHSAPQPAPHLVLHIPGENKDPAPTARAREEKVPGDEAPGMLQSFLQSWELPALWGMRAPKLDHEYSKVRFIADADGNPSLEDFIAGEGCFESDHLSVKAVTFLFPQDGASDREEDQEASLIVELSRRVDLNPDIYGMKDPFAPADRTIPTGREHLICHDDDPADAVTQVLKIGMDGRARTSKLTRYEFSASGRWLNPSTFEMEVRNTECAGCARIHATFFRGMLTLQAQSQIPEESSLTSRPCSGMHFTEA